jgi:DNA-binding YbaB/EbfC family protein
MPDEIQPARADLEPAADGQGGFDLGALLGAAQEMQAQMQAAQAEVEAQVFEGVAGGGMVKVSITGSTTVVGVAINPEVVDPAGVEMLEDLVTAAISDALSQVARAQSSSLGSVMPSGLTGSLGDLFGT